MTNSELENWFVARPQWLQDAARRVFSAGIITVEDVKELVILCKREAGVAVEDSEPLNVVPIKATDFNVGAEPLTLRLNAISAVQGINALAPKIPLEFGLENLVVVYGANGSGKSGYTRILKQACGAKGAKPLHGDVFASGREVQSCEISYTRDSTQSNTVWSPTVGALSALRRVALYDTDSAHIYVNDENELAFEPPLLSHFSLLVDACETVGRSIDAEVASLVSRRPALPPEFSSSSTGTWFTALSAETESATVDEHCTWPPELSTELIGLTARLAETNPAEKARLVRKSKLQLAALRASLVSAADSVSDDLFLLLTKARATALDKRRAADVDARRVFENLSLEGVASASWKLLWEQARNYSQTEAYIDIEFPNVAENALCVLCQQSLDETARNRLKNFETFVRGQLELEAVAAEKALAELTEAIVTAPAGTELDTSLDASGVTASAFRDAIVQTSEKINRRITMFATASEITELPALDIQTDLQALTELDIKFESEAIALEKAVTDSNRETIAARKLELAARQWCSQQRTAIEQEVSRLRAVGKLQSARVLTTTTALSSKKSALSENLITEAFKARFLMEMKALGGGRIRICIEKTKTTKGQVLHRIALVDGKQKAKIAEILSEGEFRIASLAAFLADLLASNDSTPFIFDDPISSLDQDFEELTAARLVALSQDRQVIVFTHRLSFLSMLQTEAKTQEVDCGIISVRRESWGAGNPQGPPLPAQKPTQALNTLKDARLTKARKIWETVGGTDYQVEAKALSSDIRITIERLIENDLLADVVQRFRRPINTLGKMEKLARIKHSDCVFLETLMTKYSRHEHAQPDEAPVALPEPDEFKEDLTALRTWLDEFLKRAVAA